MRKYEFTGETWVCEEIALHRIKAVKDFGDVKAGALGGWIEKESNLSQEGDCWVSENAVVSENAQISGNAWVGGNAVVSEDARVYGNAQIYGNAKVSEDARVFGNAQIYENAEINDAWVLGDARIFGNAYISGDAQIHDNAQIFGNAKVCCFSDVSGNARIFGNADVGGDVWVEENAQIFGNAQVFNNARIKGNAQIHGNAYIGGDACISGDAVIKNTCDCIVFYNWWTSGLYFTWTRSNDKWSDYFPGSDDIFFGSGEELVKRAYQESELCGREYERIVKYVESIKKKRYETQVFSETRADRLLDSPCCPRF